MTQHSNEQIIRETAYYLWLDAGKPMGQPDAFWYAAITKINPPKKAKMMSKKVGQRSR